jgi:hypothetical protein
MAEEQTNAAGVTVNQAPQGRKPMKPGQTVCNQKDEKGKLCAGPLKRLQSKVYRSKEELEGEEMIYRCGKCYTIYQGPPLGYLRDPQMKRFVLAAQPDIVQPPPAPAHEPAKKEAPAKPKE